MLRSTRFSAAPVSVLLFGCVAACESRENPPLAREPVQLVSGASSVLVDEGKGSIELLYQGEVVSALDLGSLALGTVEKVDDATNYNPWGLVAALPTYGAPAGFAMRGVESFRVVSQRADELVLELVHEGGPHSHLSIAVEREDAFRLHLDARDSGTVAWLRYGFTVPESEAFYGLGEIFDHVNLRGSKRAMQLELDELESANNEAHVPVPFFIGTRGWGFFVESSYPGAFDMASSDAERVSGTFGLGTAAEQGLIGHWYAAEQPALVTRNYYETTGFPALPAPWALGPLVWRDENESQAQVESDLETMRDLDLATTGIWIDRPYATAVNTFDFDEQKFSDASAMIRKAHNLGFEVSLWHTPYLDESDDDAKELVAQAESAELYPPQVGVLLNGWGRPIDFTKPEAVDFWQGLLSNYTEAGISGFKLDYGEDVVPSLINARNVYQFSDGSDERTMHRGFTLAYHQTYAEMLAEEGGLLLARAGKWGDQKHAPVIWPGDLDARFWRHREKVSENGESFIAVGGLPASVVAGLSLGPSGFPFFGADTGGYRHSPPDAELFRRWFEQTALSSVMQIGTSTNNVAWEFNDQELLDSYRFYTRLHLRLHPYLWSLAQSIAVTGLPLQLPFGLAFPSSGKHPDDEYLLGPSLLVAPIVEPSVDSRKMLFPEGVWLDFWSGAVAQGPNEFEIFAPLGRIPLFVKAGAPIPMLRPSIDTLSPTNDPQRVDSLASDAGLLWVLVSEGPPGSFALYDGSAVTQSSDGETVELGFQPGTRWQQGAVFELIGFGEKALESVRVDGLLLESAPSFAEFELRAQSIYFDPEAKGGTLWIKVVGNGSARSVVVSKPVQR